MKILSVGTSTPILIGGDPVSEREVAHRHCRVVEVHAVARHGYAGVLRVDRGRGIEKRMTRCVEDQVPEVKATFEERDYIITG